MNPLSVSAATSPDLGDAASFAILAGTAITNTPTSVITGDVGLSPAAGSNYSGLTTSEVSGTIYAVDASGPAGAAGNNPTLVNQAKTDLITAYDDLASGANADANCDIATFGTFGSGNVDLSGFSLVPGVYCADTFTLTGTLTLVGSGVWVFRSASTLITSGTANIVGGSACDVWWQVPTSATLGTSTSLIGNILALSSITLTTNASLNGRALARNAAVTLQSNTINQSCTAVSPTPTPTITPTPTSSLISDNSSVANSSVANSDPSAPAPCIETLSTSIPTPIIIDSKRVDSDSIFLSWGPDSGTDYFNIRYGLTDGDWQYNTNVNGYSATINLLPTDQPIWIQIAARDECSIGSYSTAQLLGSPRLPDAGVGESWLKNTIASFVNSFNAWLSLF